MWCRTVGPGSAINSMCAACCAYWGQRGWLLTWSTLQKWAMDINSSVYSWSKIFFFFYSLLCGVIYLCFIQFDIELDTFNNFKCVTQLNLSIGFSLNCEKFQMPFWLTLSEIISSQILGICMVQLPLTGNSQTFFSGLKDVLKCQWNGGLSTSYHGKLDSAWW